MMQTSPLFLLLSVLIFALLIALFIIVFLRAIANAVWNRPTWKGIIISAIFGLLPLYLILCALGIMGEDERLK